LPFAVWFYIISSQHPAAKGSNFMKNNLNEASRWRVDMARELCSCYSSHPDVMMVCLGGSSARGIADEWSDLDILIYWKGIDENWIKSEPLGAAKGISRTALMNTSPESFLESYHIGGLKIDFAHVRLDDWIEWLKPLHGETSPDNELIGMAGGFLSSIVFHGEEEFQKIARSLSVYPDSLALDVIQKNLGFYVNGYLEGQCLQRGDLLAWHDGLVLMLKKLLNITAALNRYYFHAGEARWAEYHLAQMKHKASGFTWANVLQMLENPGPETASMLYSIQMETLDLIATQFPELSERIEIRKTRMASLEVKSCSARPSL
jgi:hypothetical protein